MAATDSDTQPSGSTPGGIDVARTRDGMGPTTRAVSDTLDEYLHRHHGILTSHTNAEDFITWLGEQGYEVRAAGRTETTTATTEDAARVVRPFIDRHEDSGYDLDGKEVDESAREAAQALADAGLLRQP